MKQETGTFNYVNEIACINTYSDACNYCSGSCGGKRYFGRGAFQLSWNYNYDAFSRAFYGDNRLLNSPDNVATDPALAIGSAIWFYSTYQSSKGVMRE